MLEGSTKTSKMKKATGLQVCSPLTFLVAVAIAAPHTTTHSGLNPNLKVIINKIEDYNKTVSKELYVPDVSNLTEGRGRCGVKFFCKVEDILLKHWNDSEHKHSQDLELARNLNVFNQHKNCMEVLKHVPSSPVMIQLSNFLTYIVECIRCRNLKVSRPNCST